MRKIGIAFIMVMAIALIFATSALIGAVVGALIAPILTMDVTPHSAHWSARWILCQLCIPAECGSKWGKRARAVSPLEDSLPGRL